MEPQEEEEEEKCEKVVEFNCCGECPFWIVEPQEEEEEEEKCEKVVEFNCCD